MNMSDSIKELKECFVQAGFIDSVELLNDICPMPDNALVMHNNYSLMVGCEALLGEGDTDFPLVDQKEEMHAFIRKALFALENQKGLIVDGYLLIILKQEPDTVLTEIIRKMELDTKVCRKHILWPKQNESGLDRLEFVTILSLPEPLKSNSVNAVPFELSAEASKLLSKYDELKSLDRLLDVIKNGGFSDVD